MKIQITNANPDPANSGFDNLLVQVEQALKGQGHSVTQLTLREMDLRGCNGCLGCWVKTPGECVQPDDGPRLRQAILQPDLHLLASPLRMGFVSALAKTALDKFLPLIHPYIVVDHGEAHHLARYPRYPRLGLLLEPESSTDPTDLAIVTDIFSRVALNMKSQLSFVAQSSQPLDQIVAQITAPVGKTGLPFLENLGPTQGQRITPPTRLTVFNGSPRGKKGNTPILLGHFLRGFESLPGRSHEIYDLNRIHDREIFRQAYADAECVLLGFPLYVDSLPGQVKAFIESLADLTTRPNNPPMGFLVQSGFPEALHSRHVERYLEKLSARLGSPYLGCMVRGNLEGIQVQPEKMTAKLFDSMYQLGRAFGESGQFDPALLRTLAGMERVPAYILPIMKLLSRTGVLNGYFADQLKQNGVYEQRFARPYHQ